MAFRFRKSIKLAPGIKMNISGSGLGWTIGPRGASIGIGKSGTYFNAGIPGTGLSYREKISGEKRQCKANRGVPRTGSMKISIDVDEGGAILFRDGFGQALESDIVDIAKKQHGDLIKKLIQEKCDEINGNINAIGEMHAFTPGPNEKPRYIPVEFQIRPPIEPIPKKAGILRVLFSSVKTKVENENKLAMENYTQELERWRLENEKFTLGQEIIKDKIERQIYNNVMVMEEILEDRLQAIEWPKETDVSFDIRDDGKAIYMDVDLPEIEDMPNKFAEAPMRGNKINVKDMSDAQVRKLYMRHVHAIAFRLIGEVFALLPGVNLVVVSGYSQRGNKITGIISDEYLYSVKVLRTQWVTLNFNNIKCIDIVESLSAFEMRRSMSKTGIFKEIKPFD